jgi:hypothetical protein
MSTVRAKKKDPSKPFRVSSKEFEISVCPMYKSIANKDEKATIELCHLHSNKNKKYTCKIYEKSSVTFYKEMELDLYKKLSKLKKKGNKGEDSPFLPMRFFCVEGGKTVMAFEKVACILGKYDPRTPLQEIQILLVVAKGLQAVNQLGYALVDLSLHTVVKDYDGAWKLFNFRHLTQLDHIIERNFLELHDYFAPEMLEGQEASIMTDSWTLGIFALKLLLKQDPLTNAVQNELKRHKSAIIKELNDERVNKKLIIAITGLLNEKPSKRMKLQTFIDIISMELGEVKQKAEDEKNKSALMMELEENRAFREQYYKKEGTASTKRSKKQSKAKKRYKSMKTNTRITNRQRKKVGSKNYFKSITSLDQSPRFSDSKTSPKFSEFRNSPMMVKRTISQSVVLKPNGKKKYGSIKYKEKSYKIKKKKQFVEEEEKSFFSVLFGVLGCGCAEV